MNDALPSLRVGAFRVPVAGGPSALMSRALVAGGELFSVVGASSEPVARQVLERLEAGLSTPDAGGGSPGALAEVVRRAVADLPSAITTDLRVLVAVVVGGRVELARLGTAVAFRVRGAATSLFPVAPPSSRPGIERCGFDARGGDTVVLCSGEAGFDEATVRASVETKGTAEDAAEALTEVARGTSGDICVQVLRFAPVAASSPRRKATGPGVVSVLGSWQVLTALAIGALLLGIRFATHRGPDVATAVGPTPAPLSAPPGPPADAPTAAPVPASTTPATTLAAAPPVAPARPSVARRPAPTPRPAWVPATMPPPPPVLRVYVLVLRFGDPGQARTAAEGVRAALAPREVEVVPVFANQVEALAERSVYFRPEARAEAARVARRFEYEVHEMPRELRDRFAEAAAVVVPGGAQ